ncbi:unnamed protein product [Oreochromis niloticus]|nr:unnamed protein product [Mustela putorius furo]
MCKYSLSVRSPAGELGIIKLNHSKKQQKTVKDLKIKAAQLFPKKGYLLAEFRQIVSGKPLDDDSASLSEYGIKPSSVVQMVAKVHGGDINLPVYSKSTEDLTVRRFKNELLERQTFPGYTKDDVRLHIGEKPLADYCSSNIQMMTNLKGSQLCLLNQAMCQIVVISPDGKRCLMFLWDIQLQVMTVGCFKEKVLKMFIIQVFVDYTRENVKLHIDGKPLDDDSAPLFKCEIKHGSVVQMVRKVNGG